MENITTITYQDFNRAIHNKHKSVDGVIYQEIGKNHRGDMLYLVFGYDEGYDKDENLYQVEENGIVYTLCAKLAYNIDDLQCDYDIDWYMPYLENGDVIDTNQAVGKIHYGEEWYNSQAQLLLQAQYDDDEIGKIVKL